MQGAGLYHKMLPKQPLAMGPYAEGLVPVSSLKRKEKGSSSVPA